MHGEGGRKTKEKECETAARRYPGSTSISQLHGRCRGRLYEVADSLNFLLSDHHEVPSIVLESRTKIPILGQHYQCINDRRWKPHFNTDMPLQISNLLFSKEEGKTRCGRRGRTGRYLLSLLSIANQKPMQMIDRVA